MKKKKGKFGEFISTWIVTFFIIMIIIAIIVPADENSHTDTPDIAIWVALIIPTLLSFACAKEPNKDEKEKKKKTLPSTTVWVILLLVVDGLMLRMVPTAYSSPPYWMILAIFLLATALCTFSIYANIYMSKNKWDVISLNEKMNNSVDLDDYFKSRDGLIEKLSKMKKMELFINKNNRLSDRPSNILRQIEENKDLHIHTAIIRMTAHFKRLAKENKGNFGELFRAELARHKDRLSADNKDTGVACALILDQYEAVVGKIEEVDGMEGHAFEHWCAELLKKNGFTNVEVTKGSGDQGVDVLAVKDGIKYAVQCKCYSSDLGNKPVQEVHAGKAMYHCQVGAVMTNRHFTLGAKELAEATGVLLWDREKLEEMLTTAAP